MPIRVNVRRRSRHVPTVRCRDVRRSLVSTDEPVLADEAVLADDRQLWRQREYEKHLYHLELSKRGYAWSREYCTQHARDCRTAGGPHPRGGDDDPEVPDPFDPDAAPLADWEKRGQ